MYSIRIQRRQFLELTGGAASAAFLSAKASAAVAKPKIATIGAGRMGKALGAAWVKAGYEVMFSTRHPFELKDFVRGLGKGAGLGTVAEAVAFGDVIVLLVPYTSMPQIAEDHGKALAKKALVMDVSNPSPQRDGDIARQANEKGAGLWLAALLPGAKIVRAFNAVGFTSVEKYGSKTVQKTAVPIAGDDPKALEITSQLARAIGFDPVIVGDLKVAGKLLPYGTSLLGEHTAEELREIVAALK